jgi:hypothetical protein
MSFVIGNIVFGILAVLSPLVAPAMAGETPAVDQGYDLAPYIVPAAIPPVPAGDVGAFRSVVFPTHAARADPILYPGQEFAGHCHIFANNRHVDGFTTFETLRKSGEDAFGIGQGVNSSGYWVPCLQDEKGNVLAPDFISVYYKAAFVCPQGLETPGNPMCAAMTGLPHGLKTIAGYLVSKGEVHGHFGWVCYNKSWGSKGPAEHSPSLMPALDAGCGSEDGDILLGAVGFPTCWNGDSESPDHVSHLADMLRDNNTGQFSCPSTHPKLIPVHTQTYQWTLKAGEAGRTVVGDKIEYGLRLASDRMTMPDGQVMVHANGATFHADYWNGWPKDIITEWNAGCIEGYRNCQEANFGTGRGAEGRGSRYLTLAPEPPQPPPTGEVMVELARFGVATIGTLAAIDELRATAAELRAKIAELCKASGSTCPQ